MLGGLCLALAYPPFGLWPLCLITFALLGWRFSRTTSLRDALAHGWIVGAVASLLAGRWLIALVPRFTILPPAAGALLWLLACIGSGSSLGLGAMLAHTVSRNTSRAFGAFVGVLVAERFGPWLFPLPLAAPLIDAPFLPQSADLMGVQVLGALLCACATLALEAHPKRLVHSGISLATIASLCAYGAWRTPVVERAMTEAPVMRVALVQPAVGAALRWDPDARTLILRRLQQMSDDALARSPELVVWHEAAFPYALPYRAGVDGESAPAALERDARAPLLFGAMGVGDDGARYNAAFVRTPDGRLSAPVAKRVRVLFGEYIPLVGSIPLVRRVFARVQGLTAGAREELVPVNGRVLGVLNCLEDTVPQSGAEVARADLLVNITNDAWFDGAEPAQHVFEARWRAIETRREIVRAVNTAMSGHIDALGRPVALAAPNEVRVMMVHPRVALALRPWSPWVIRLAPWAALLSAVASIALFEARRRRSA